MRVASLLVAVLGAAAFPAATSASRETPRARLAARSAREAGEAGELAREDRGLYVAFCPPHEEAASIASRSSSLSPSGDDARADAASPPAKVAEASHEGWSADECLKMDKGPAGDSHTLVGLKHVHNWLLGGYGNDTLYAGEAGDVLWGDYHPEGQSEDQRDYIHGGRGEDWIYSSHGFNEIWTGAGNDHLALVYGHGVVFCDGPGVKTFVMRYLPENRPWKLVGCAHKVLVRYRA
jgi:RTX calcium-binding nonapeptide repeat (4 copies)